MKKPASLKISKSLVKAIADSIRYHSTEGSDLGMWLDIFSSPDVYKVREKSEQGKDIGSSCFQFAWKLYLQDINDHYRTVREDVGKFTRKGGLDWEEFQFGVCPQIPLEVFIETAKEEKAIRIDVQDDYTVTVLSIGE